MNFHQLQARLKPWMMPVAILTGILFHKQINVVEWVVPYLIFSMLLLTFCRIEPRELRFDRSMWLLLGVQLIGGMGIYFVLMPINITLAQAVMMCVLCPVATAAPVVTGMLGGNIGRVAAFSVISNLGVAVCAPLFFAWIAPRQDQTFFMEFRDIALRVTPMIVLPLLTAFLLRFSAPRVHARLATAAPVAFYLWSVSLIIVVGRSISFVLAEPESYWPVMAMMALGAAVMCVMQFWLGRRIGHAMGDAVTSGQSLAQKNTVLAIWMASTYLTGVSSVGPAAYVIWQNTFNSWQLYRHMRAGVRKESPGKA